MKYKNTWLLSFVSSLILGLILILSLTNPFFGLSAFLEKLVNKNYESCECLCPWWIFTILQIFISKLILKYFESKNEKKRKNYILTLSITGIFIWILHFIIHNIFTSNNSFSPSIFCSWFWLIVLITALIYFLVNPNKK